MLWARRFRHSDIDTLQGEHRDSPHFGTGKDAGNVAIAPSRTASLLELRASEVARGVGNTHPLFIERGSGAMVWDVEGTQYIDFVGGIGSSMSVTQSACRGRDPRSAGPLLAHVLSSRDVRFVRRAGTQAQSARAWPEPQEDAVAEHRRGSDRERGQDRARIHAAGRPSSRSNTATTAARCSRFR